MKIETRIESSPEAIGLARESDTSYNVVNVSNQTIYESSDKAMNHRLFTVLANRLDVADLLDSGEIAVSTGFASVSRWTLVYLASWSKFSARYLRDVGDSARWALQYNANNDGALKLHYRSCTGNTDILISTYRETVCVKGRFSYKLMRDLYDEKIAIQQKYPLVINLTRAEYESARYESSWPDWANVDDVHVDDGHAVDAELVLGRDIYVPSDFPVGLAALADRYTIVRPVH